MCITNTNIFQPRILPKPELNETLPKTNLKIIQLGTWPVLLTPAGQKKCPSAEGLGIKKSNPPFIREGGGRAPPPKLIIAVRIIPAAFIRADLEEGAPNTCRENIECRNITPRTFINIHTGRSNRLEHIQHIRLLGRINT